MDLNDALLPGSQSSTKENDAPIDIATTGNLRDQVHDAYRLQSPPTDPQPFAPRSPRDQRSSESVDPPAGALPPDLLSSYQFSTHVLEQDFANSPPYTIQRLAELVLEPRRHYRFLPAYLRALDRVVSVSSPISDFPLPTLNPARHTATNGGGFLTNGDTNPAYAATERDGLGSDESLGGALLTPIPWLRSNGNALSGSSASQDGEYHSESTETMETVPVTANVAPFASSAAHTPLSPTSPSLSEQSDASSPSSSAESVESQLRLQGGVTQGELLRQEQEAGVVPVSQTSPRRSLLSGNAMAAGREPVLLLRDAGVGNADERPEEHPHARGPDLVGMEDMGPQHHALGGSAGLDMDAAVGRSSSPPSQSQTEAHAATSAANVSSNSQLDGGRNFAPLNHVRAAPAATAAAARAEHDDAGRAGQDPQDVEKSVEKLRRAMDQEMQAEARDIDGDVVLADADGREVEEVEEMEVL